MPTAYGYARISPLEAEIECPKCNCEFTPGEKNAESFDCPQCGEAITAASLTHSISTQFVAIEAYWQSALSSRELLKIACEMESASVNLRKRERAGKLFDLLERGDQLIVTSLDRGWATPADFFQDVGTFQDRGVGIHIVDRNIAWTWDDDGVTETIVALADFQRRSGGSLIKEGLARLKKEGTIANGRAPVAKVIVCNTCNRAYGPSGARCVGCGTPRKGCCRVDDSGVDHAIMRQLLGLREVVDPMPWTDIAKMFRRRRIHGKYGTTYCMRQLQNLHQLARELIERGALMSDSEIEAALETQRPAA